MSLTAAQLLADVIDATAPPVARPGDFTLEDYRRAYAEQRGIEVSDTTAKRWLDKAVSAGAIESEMVLCDGRIRRVYRRAKRQLPHS